MHSSMTNDPKVLRKSIRIQVETTHDGPSHAVPPRTPPPVNLMAKSILKNCDDAPTTPPIWPDPLQSETYFLGPLRTLAASVKDEDGRNLSLHDITEAYILLSSRIEAEAENLTDETLPAVAAIQTVPSHLICAAIRRDVSRAISGPQAPTGIVLNQGNMTEEEKICVKDRSSACHAALRFVANLFRFTIIHHSFKLHELAWMMKELLDVGLSNELVTLNPQKTYSLVMSAIIYQCLPDVVLRPSLSKITALIERAASGLMGGNATSGPHSDGLKATAVNLRRNGPLFFPVFHNVLKVVLQNLVCPMSAFRELAANALAAFAHAALRTEIPIRDQIKASAIIDAFIEKEAYRAKTVNKKDPNTFVLHDFLRIKEDDPLHVRHVTLLLNIVAAFLVLSGPRIFVRPNSLRFFLKAIEKTQAYRYRELNRLRSATWSCLVRAYGSLHSWNIPVDQALEESAFQVIRQEYRDDVGVSVVAVLLAPQEGGLRPLCRVLEAASYLCHLGQMPETRVISVSILRRLLGGVLNDADSDTCTWASPASIIPEWMSNGLTMGMDPRRLKKSMAVTTGIDMHTVRTLEAKELMSAWESLVEVFQVCAIGQLFDKKADNALQSDTLLLWRALLRIQSTLADSFSRDNVSMPVLSCIASALCAFLDAIHARFPIRPSQAILATHQLWEISNDVLGPLWGSALAGSIYRRLLTNWQLEIASNSMCTGWTQLSRALVQASPKRTLEILREIHNGDAQRVVWLDMARDVRAQAPPSMELISRLLLFPIETTELIVRNEDDRSFWEMLLLLALMHEDPDKVFTMVSEGLVRALDVRACSELRAFFCLTLSHASRSDTFPNLSLLSVTSDFLGEAYPPERCEDNEFMDVAPSLQKILSTYPDLNVIKALEKGLRPWFEDRKAYLRDAAYNDDILPVYCDVFQAIRRISPMEQAMIELAELLAAPFLRERIPEPAVGPIAFKQFWDNNGPSLKFLPQDFPSILSDCITSLHSAFGGYLPEWMESQLDSQNSHTTDIIPPSVEDLESSEFSPKFLKQLTTSADDSGVAKTRGATDGDSVEEVKTPSVSPSIGMKSPRFARYRRVNNSESPIKLNLERATKKRKVPESASAEAADGMDCSNDDDGTSVDKWVLSSPGASQLSPEDYTSWEIKLSTQDMHYLQEMDDERTPRPGDYQSYPWDSAVSDSTGESSPVCNAPHANSDHRIMRSQTAPASIQASSEEAQTSRDEQSCSPGKLRRLHTTTDVPLDTLEKLHAQLSADAGILETQDLAHATKLAHDMLGILNGRMTEKLGSRK